MGAFQPAFPEFCCFSATAKAGIKLRLMGCKGYFRPRKTGHKKKGVAKKNGYPKMDGL